MVNDFNVSDLVDVRYSMLDGTEVWIPGRVTAKSEVDLTVTLEDNEFRFRYIFINENQLERLRKR